MKIRAILAALALSFPCWGTIYYVAPGGNDGDPGTEALPWGTLSRSANQVQAGDTVLIRGGLYAGANAVMDVPPGTTGTAGSPITFKAYAGEHPVLDMQNVYSAAVLSAGESHFVYEGLTVERPRMYNGAFNFFNGAAQLDRPAPELMNIRHVTVERCTVSNWVYPSNGGEHHTVFKMHGTTDVTIRNCTFHQIRSTAGGYGMTMTGYFNDRITFENNLVYDSDIAYLDKADDRYTLFRHNYIHDVGRGFNGNVGPGDFGWDVKIYENIFCNLQANTIAAMYDSPNMRIFNNTIWEGHLGGVSGMGTIDIMSTIDEEPWHIWNNVFYKQDSRTDYMSGPNDTAPYIDYNCFGPDPFRGWCGAEGIDYYDLAGWQAGGLSQLHGWDQHSIEADPQLVSPVPSSPEDFHLQPGSPCVHAGTNHLGDSPGYDAGAPDMGAYPRGNDGTVIGLLPAGTPTVGITVPTATGSYTATSASLDLGGVASDDVGVTSVTWENLSTGASGTAIGTMAWTATVPLQGGMNIVNVFAHDGDANTSPASTLTVTYWVAAENDAPVADAGPNQSNTVGNTITFDASGSYDPDGNPSPLSYQWVQTGGTTVSLSGASGSIAWFVASEAGTLTFEVTVYDGLEYSTADETIAIVVGAGENVPPVADAGSDRSVEMAAPVTLDGSASTDVGGSISTHLWEQLSGASITLSGGNTATAAFTPADAGSFLFQLTVTDDEGAAGTDEVTITVTGVTRTNTPPPPTIETNDDEEDTAADDDQAATELAVLPNVVAAGETAGVTVIGPITLAGENVRIYGVSGELIGELVLEESGDSAETGLDPAWKLGSGVYLAVAETHGLLYRARFVIRP